MYYIEMGIDHNELCQCPICVAAKHPETFIPEVKGLYIDKTSEILKLTSLAFDQSAHAWFVHYVKWESNGNYNEEQVMSLGQWNVLVKLFTKE